MFQIRWPDGYRCPKCGHNQFYCIGNCRHRNA
ncbi:MAG: transposase [Bacillota bacterium]